MSRADNSPAAAQDEPGRLLKDLIASGHELSSRFAREVGLGVTDFRALDVLLEIGSAGPNELGRRLGLTSPAATALADRLEDAGHIERVRDPEDRRRVALVPTEHAYREAWRAVGPFVEAVTAATAELSADERAVVSRFLSRILELQRAHTSG